jgi:hypothetical protein
MGRPAQTTRSWGSGRRGRWLARGVVLATTVALLGISPVVAPPAGADIDDEVRINEVQVVGSHNSYKRWLAPAEERVLRSFIGDGVNLMQYQHEPLDVQFQSQKVRQIELDVFADGSGGLYADPLLRSVAGVGPYAPAMQAPGTKVLHIQDVDYRSSCLTIVACLEVIEAWSDANPSHLPIAILVELKDSPLSFGEFTFTTPEPWTAAAMDTLDAEIRSVVDANDMITPDDVRGGAATLEEAVLSTGWPTLGEARGKLMFFMDNAGSYRTRYLDGHPSLAGRVMFTNSSPGQPDAAFVKRNDPFSADIADLVAAGYLVRTRSDAETIEARENDTGPRDAALASGAQWVSTDYPVRGLTLGFESDFVVEIPGGTVARCNPINGPATCDSALLDTIFTPVAPPSRPAPTPPTAPAPALPASAPPAGRDADAPPAVPVTGTPSYTG